MTQKDIERVLIVKGYAPTIDGIKGFQNCVGLTADGIAGPKTQAEMMNFKRHGMQTTAEIIQRFGQPGDTKNFTIISLPYPQKVSWDKGEIITKMQVHKLVADRMLAVYSEVLNVYGLEDIQSLGIDIYGGCYNYRQMRGGTEWSRHSWAIAVDHDPERNQLKETRDTARFARPEYAAFIWIWYKHGFVSQGVEKNFDWMHFEAAN